MSNSDKNMQSTPTNFQQRSHNDDMLTIQKLAELQSKNVLDLPTLSIAKYLNEIICKYLPCVSSFKKSRKIHKTFLIEQPATHFLLR